MSKDKQEKQVVMSYFEHQRMVEREQMFSVMVDQFKSYIRELMDSEHIVYITERPGWYEHHIPKRNDMSYGLNSIYVPSIIGEDEVATALDGEFRRCTDEIKRLAAKRNELYAEVSRLGNENRDLNGTIKYIKSHLSKRWLRRKGIYNE